MFIYISTLVMMTQNNRALAERGFGGKDAALAGIVLQGFETVKSNGSGLHQHTQNQKGLKHYHNITEIPSVNCISGLISRIESSHYARQTRDLALSAPQYA